MARGAVAAVVSAQPKETKNQAFIRLAQKRMTGLKRQGRLVGNLLGPTYESTPQQRQKIIEAAFDLAEALRIAADKTGNTNPDEFSF